MKNYFLGIDNGGTVSKAALFDQFGTEIGVGLRSVQVVSNVHDQSERDMEQLWIDTVAAIRDAIAVSGISPSQIRAVSPTGHGNGLYLLDKSGKPLRNAINSYDYRATAYIDRWHKTGVDLRALPLTAQSIWAAQPNALLAWIRDREPETFDRIGSILMAKDYIRYRLTGEIAAEITDMSATSLMNVTTGTYDDAVLDLFGLKAIKEMLPPLIGSTDIAGYITPQAAKATGLKEGTPVIGGMFDIDACALSSGVLSSSEFSIIAGTWGNNQYIAKEPLIDKELFMTSRYAIDGWFLMLEGSPTSAGNLEWYISNFLAHEKQKKGAAFYDWLSQSVADVKVESSDVIFTPFIYGCNVGQQRAGFHGMNTKTTQASLTRAVFEGVVFSHNWHIKRLLAFREIPEVIRLTGGASKSSVWSQMFADVTGIPVEVPKGSELGALGASIAAAYAVGEYASIKEAVDNMTPIECRYLPSTRSNAIYKQKYEHYLNLITP